MKDTQVITEDEEVTLKDIIITIKDYWSHLWKKKWWVIFFGLFGGAVFLTYGFLKPKEYSASLTYLVNDEEGNKQGGLSSVLGQFGLGGRGNNNYNLDKIIALSRSQRIVKSALLDSIEIEGVNDMLANHLIDSLSFHEEWEKDKLLKNFRFLSDSSSGKNLQENKAINTLYRTIVGNPKEGVAGLMETSYDDETGILKLNSITRNQYLSLALNELIYEHISKFYVKESIGSQTVTVKVLKARLDSISNTLQSTEVRLAAAMDRGSGINLRRDQLRIEQLAREKQLLIILYGEVTKNYETAVFLLNNTTPVFQTLDVTLPPMGAINRGLPKKLVLGGLLGGVLSVSFLLGGKIIREALSEDS